MRAAMEAVDETEARRLELELLEALTGLSADDLDEWAEDGGGKQALRVH